MVSSALVLAGCDSGSDMSACNGTVSGLYAEVGGREIAMNVTQCGSGVSGTLTYEGVDFPLEGQVENGELTFATDPVELCSSINSTRWLSSNQPIEIVRDGEELSGSFRIRDSSCSTNRGRIEGYPARLFRR